MEEREFTPEQHQDWTYQHDYTHTLVAHDWVQLIGRYKDTSCIICYPVQSDLETTHSRKLRRLFTRLRAERLTKKTQELINRFAENQPTGRRQIGLARRILYSIRYTEYCETWDTHIQTLQENFIRRATIRQIFLINWISDLTDYHKRYLREERVRDLNIRFQLRISSSENNNEDAIESVIEDELAEQQITYQPIENFENENREENSQTTTDNNILDDQTEYSTPPPVYISVTLRLPGTNLAPYEDYSSTPVVASGSRTRDTRPRSASLPPPPPYSATRTDTDLD